MTDTEGSILRTRTKNWAVPEFHLPSFSLLTLLGRNMNRIKVQTFYWRDWGKLRRTSIRIAGLLTDLKPIPPEYETRVLIIQLRRTVILKLIFFNIPLVNLTDTHCLSTVSARKLQVRILPCCRWAKQVVSSPTLCTSSDSLGSSLL